MAKAILRWSAVGVVSSVIAGAIYVALVLWADERNQRFYERKEARRAPHWAQRLG